MILVTIMEMQTEQIDNTIERNQNVNIVLVCYCSCLSLNVMHYSRDATIYYINTYVVYHIV